MFLSPNMPEAGRAHVVNPVFQNVADIPELADNDSALDFAHVHKNSNPVLCPRCGSHYTKKINSGVFRELSRCVDCTYMFNCLAGTVFQGTKISLLRFFQAIVIFDHSPESEKTKNIAYHIDVSQKTARNVGRIVSAFRDISDYSEITSGPVGHGLHNETIKNHRFLNFCESKNLLVSRDRFLMKIQAILDHRIKPSSDR